MNSIKNGVLAACIAYIALTVLAFIGSENDGVRLIAYGSVPCAGLMAWSLSGRKNRDKQVG